MSSQSRSTIEDVARLAGVSSKTVSRVYSQRDIVSPETVERVLTAARRLRFRPNMLAKNLRRGSSSQAVGFIMGDLSNPFYYKVASGIVDELSTADYALIVATTDDTDTGEERAVATLIAQRIAALILIPVAEDQSYFDDERQLGTPIITIDRPARNLVADSVVLENYEGAYEATRRLLSLGHERIAYVCNPSDVYTQFERVRGYRQAMKDHGIHNTEAFESLNNDREARPEITVAALLDSQQAPTAFITGNNRTTIGALQAFKNKNLSHLPALIGFDDFDTADLLGVTVISYDPVELGRQAARFAIKQISDPTGFTSQVKLPTHIIPRGTGERLPTTKN